MPISALSGFFGVIAAILLVYPTVNLSSGNGNAIMFGEKDLTDTMLDLGTAVYEVSTCSKSCH
jgi:hypothetical protein